MANFSKKSLFSSNSSAGATTIADISGDLVGGVATTVDITGKTVLNVLVLDSTGQKTDVDYQISGNNLLITASGDVTGATIRITVK